MTNCIKNKKQKGFTLTELIIVIVIIGILAAVLIPSLSGYIKKAKKSAAEQDAMTIYQNFMATVDEEDYADVSVLNYVVKTDKYYVVIQKGAKVGSVEISEATKVDTKDAYYVNANASSTDLTSNDFSDDIASLALNTTNTTITDAYFLILDDTTKFNEIFTNVEGVLKVAASKVAQVAKVA